MFVANSGQEAPGFEGCQWDSNVSAIDVSVENWKEVFDFIQKERGLKDYIPSNLPSSDRYSQEANPTIVNLELLGLAIVFTPREKLKKKGPKTVKFRLINLPCEKIHECIENFNRRLQTSSSLRFSNIPKSWIPDYVGRAQAFSDVHNLLTTSPNPRFLAVVGMAGLGKTEFAIQYANRYAYAYDGEVCWVNIRGGDPLQQIIDYAKLSRRLAVDSQPRENLQSFWELWGNQKVLIIFDDINELSEISHALPIRENFAVLITTRNKGLEYPVRNYELQDLTEENAIRLLASYISKERVEREYLYVLQIIQFMENLPLGIELIGRYISRRTKIGRTEPLEKTISRLENKRDNWKRNSSGVMKSEALKFHGEVLTTAQRGVKAAFDLTWDLLADTTQRIATYVSIFDYGGVLWDVLTETLAIEFEEHKDPDFEFGKVENSLLELLQFSLLKAVEESDQIYSYHPLIKDFFRSKMTREDREAWGDIIDE